MTANNNNLKILEYKKVKITLKNKEISLDLISM